MAALLDPGTQRPVAFGQKIPDPPPQQKRRARRRKLRQIVPFYSLDADPLQNPFQRVEIVQRGLAGQRATNILVHPLARRDHPQEQGSQDGGDQGPRQPRTPALQSQPASFAAVDPPRRRSNWSHSDSTRSASAARPA